MVERSSLKLPPIFNTWLDPATWHVRRGSLDYQSPLWTYFLIRKKYRPAFLLESADGPEKVSRFSIITFDPLTHVSGLFDYGNQWDLFSKASEKCHTVKVPERQTWATFLGWYGYVAYEMLGTFEPVTFRHTRDLDIPDFYFMLPGQVIVFDHVERSITHLFHGSKDPWPWDSEVSSTPSPSFMEFPAGKRQSLPDTLPSSENFLQTVERAAQYIREGDILQVVLSRRFTRPYPYDPLDLYRVLRILNPSPYMFFLAFNGTALLGSSPEMLIRRDFEKACIRPIAGTRPKGQTDEEDRQLIEELTTSTKERAEHTMLVDLARNDLGRIAVPGGVHIERLMDVETYSHVFHLTSEVTSQVRPEALAMEVLAAGFPAGTVTGAPKVRAAQIIDELEPVRRQFYGGGIGYIGMGRRLNFCIAIRTALVQRSQLIIQAGAGIVADSDPIHEDEECRHKAMALWQAADYVENFHE